MEKSQFLRQYSVHFPIPAFYLIDSKLYAPDTNYSINMVKMVLPPRDNVECVLHNADGSERLTTYHDLFQKYTNNLVLRLIRQQDASLHVEDEAVIEAS